MEEVTIYTDGAYSPSRDIGGIGIVFIKDDGKEIKYSRSFKHTTNNRMELIAVIIAIYSIQNIKAIINLYTDSQYVIGCASKGWNRNKNQDLWKIFDEITYSRTINYNWVKGHSTNKYNIITDKLAQNETLDI